MICRRKLITCKVQKICWGGLWTMWIQLTQRSKGSSAFVCFSQMSPLGCLESRHQNHSSMGRGPFYQRQHPPYSQTLQWLFSHLPKFRTFYSFLPGIFQTQSYKWLGSRPHSSKKKKMCRQSPNSWGGCLHTNLMGTRSPFGEIQLKQGWLKCKACICIKV